MDRDDLYVSKTRQKAESKKLNWHTLIAYIFTITLHRINSSLYKLGKLQLCTSPSSWFNHLHFFLPAVPIKCQYRPRFTGLMRRRRRRRQVKINLHFTSEIPDSLDLFVTPMALKTPNMQRRRSIPNEKTN